MKNPIESAILQVTGFVLAGGYRRATKFISPTLIVRASRRFKHRGWDRTDEVVLTVGKPNYAEREFIKLCRKACEKFPVKKIQVRSWPKK